MRRAIAAGNAAAIETELHIQILNADVMNQLIKSALKESGIDRANRFQAFTRHSGGKGHAMLFGDAHIKRSFGKLLQRVADAGAVRHRRGQGNDLFVLLHQLAQACCQKLRCRSGRLPPT